MSKKARKCRELANEAVSAGFIIAMVSEKKDKHKYAHQIEMIMNIYEILNPVLNNDLKQVANEIYNELKSIGVNGKSRPLISQTDKQLLGIG